jgi:hypothetical protein
LSSSGFRLDFRPHKVYFFELRIKFYIKSSLKTLKLVNFSHGSEKGAKNSYGSYPTEFVSEVKNTKITLVRSIPSVIQKDHLKGFFKNRADKILIWTAMNLRQTADGRVTDSFFRKNLFFLIKSPNSLRKSINFFFWKSRNEYFILTSLI